MKKAKPTFSIEKTTSGSWTLKRGDRRRSAIGEYATRDEAREKAADLIASAKNASVGDVSKGEDYEYIFVVVTTA